MNTMEVKLREVLPDHAIQFGEDGSFEQPSSGIWLRFTDREGSAGHLEVSGALIEQDGLAVVDIFASGGVGEDACRDLGARLVAAFHLLELSDRKVGFKQPGWARPSYPSEAPGWTHWKTFLPYTRQEVRARAS